MKIINEGEYKNTQLKGRLSGMELNLHTFNGAAESASESSMVDGLSLIGEE